MVLGLNSPSWPYPQNLSWCQWLTRLRQAAEAAATHDWSAVDPSASAPATWGEREAGRHWEDVGVDGTLVNPVGKKWRKLTAAGSWGWKKRCTPYHKRLTTRAQVLDLDDLAVDTPGGGAWTALSLASELNLHQDAAEHRVIEVLLDVQIVEAGTVGSARVELRTPGSDNAIAIYAPAAGVPAHTREWIVLDASEELEYRVFVGGGSPDCHVDLWLHGFRELQ